VLVSASRRNNLLEKVESCMECDGSRKVRDRETRSPARETHALPGKCTQIVGHLRIFRRQRFDIAGFDVDFLSAGPFEFENRTSNIDRPTPKGFASKHQIGSWISNLKFQITKIEQA
jgi:hypothetical protein